MTEIGMVQHSTYQNRVVRRPSAGRPRRVHSPIRILASLRSPRAVLKFLDLSLSQAGAELARVMNVDRIPKQTLHDRVSGRRPMQSEMVRALGVLLAERLTSRARGFDVGVTVSVNSPWRIAAYAQCRCGAWTRMDTLRRPHCKTCKRKNR